MLAQGRVIARLACIFAALLSTCGVFGYDDLNPCAHEEYPDMGKPTELQDGSSVYVEQLRRNKTQLYSFKTLNETLMHQPDQYRKLIVHLEPCKGVVYLFLRKTRRCFPNPYSTGCMIQDASSGSANAAETVPNPDNCEWTHYMSRIDGTRDGAPTFFELPLTSTSYYMAVYAKETASYTLTIVTDIGVFPRPGYEGLLTARQLQDELQVEIGWHTASYIPQGISETKKYWIYSAKLLDNDFRTNSNVFLTKKKIMNTVCGLQNNTDKNVAEIPASRCHEGRCNATIDGIITGKRYIFNVVAESLARYNMSYAGLILQTEWTVTHRAASQKTLQVIGAITGAVLGMVIIIYVWMINLYGR